MLYMYMYVIIYRLTTLAVIVKHVTLEANRTFANYCRANFTVWQHASFTTITAKVRGTITGCTVTVGTTTIHTVQQTDATVRSLESTNTITCCAVIIRTAIRTVQWAEATVRFLESTDTVTFCAVIIRTATIRTVQWTDTALQPFKSTHTVTFYTAIIYSASILTLQPTLCVIIDYRKFIINIT